MPKILDLKGKKFNKLTVIKKNGKIGKLNAWLCRCDCGKYKTIPGAYIKFGSVKSCGCLRGATIVNLTGKRFGRLKVIKRNGYMYDRYVAWLCRCECGKYKTLPGVFIKNGHIQSCGCLQKESTTTHGMSSHPIFKVWSSMMRRCGHHKGSGKSEKKLYRDRGIRVCKEWQLDPKVFIKWAIENGYKNGLCIDRENTNGNYKPDNCRFVTYKVNMQNARHSKRWHVNGKWYLSLRDASKHLGISHERVRQMCQGYTSSQGYTYKPKKGCRVVDLY